MKDLKIFHGYFVLMNFAVVSKARCHVQKRPSLDPRLLWANII